MLYSSVPLWVLLSLCPSFSQEDAFKPNSPHANTHFTNLADVNNATTTNQPVNYHVETATKPHLGVPSGRPGDLKLAKDMPIIVWWSKWLNFHERPTVVQCGDWSCYSTNNRTWLHAPQTRAVLFYGSDLLPEDLPLPRSTHHEWALLHEESPMNNYMLVHGPFIRLINHTATFRRESDFPLSTQSLPSISYLIERKPIPLSIKSSLQEIEDLAPVLYVQSHCDVASDRDRYVKELMKYIRVDSYGDCLNNKALPEQLKDPVKSMESPDFLNFIARYKFHIAFENAICDDYMTEKLFRPLHVGSIPIYMGSSKARDWMPDEHSVIITNDFESPKQLAEFIHNIDSTDDEYNNYLRYKSEGITNSRLLKHMSERPWGQEENTARNDFISGFECYVCKSISMAYSKDNKYGTSKSPKSASRDHLQCPQPYPSWGEINDVPSSDR